MPVTTPNSSEEAEQPTTSLTAAQIALSDPLKEETRKARLYLLVVSVVDIIMVWTGLVPKEISTLGISFEDVKPESLLDILAFVIFYFLGAFIIYGISDALAWWHAYSDVTWSELQAEAQQAQKLLVEKDDAVRKADIEGFLGENKEEETAARNSSSGQEESEEEAPDQPTSPVPDWWGERWDREFREAKEKRDKKDPTILAQREAERAAQIAHQKVERASLALSTRTTLAKGVALIRFFFEFILPIVVGGVASVVLLTA